MNLLSIAGSDPSSGAGIQADLKTFNALGANGFSVVTAITSQNTSGFFGAKPVSSQFIKSQIRSVLEDFRIDAVKIGMVYDKQTAKAISSELRNVEAPIILDPIFKSTTGGVLQMQSAFSDFKKLLIPLAYAITPNAVEAEKISGIKIKTIKDLKRTATIIQRMGSRNVIIKGGHLVKKSKVIDLLLEHNRFHTFSHDRISFESHGGGCTFSAALCASIARGKKIHDAVEFASLFTLESMRNASRVGRGLPLVKPSSKKDIESVLSDAIVKFRSIPGIYEYIPECQTNFVYTKAEPETTYDVLGIEGRIVRAGRSVIVAGKLKYGGSRHVASAVLEMVRKFPSIRSGLNIKYDDRIIKRAIAKKFRVSSYDRRLEPSRTRDEEGRTTSWGVRSAISRTKYPPDIIFHKGSIGKEPMILIFGKTPSKVIEKMMKIARIELHTSI